MATKGARFGFVISEVQAKKFYAIWDYFRSEDRKVTMTKAFEGIIEIAFIGIPETFKNLEAIKLPEPEKQEADANG